MHLILPLSLIPFLAALISEACTLEGDGLLGACADTRERERVLHKPQVKVFAACFTAYYQSQAPLHGCPFAVSVQKGEVELCD